MIKMAQDRTTSTPTSLYAIFFFFWKNKQTHKEEGKIPIKKKKRGKNILTQKHATNSTKKSCLYTIVTSEAT